MKKRFNMPELKASYFSRASILTDSAVTGTEDAMYNSMQSYNTKLQTKVSVDTGALMMDVLKSYDYN